MTPVEEAKSLMKDLLQRFQRTKTSGVDVLAEPRHHFMSDQLRSTVQAMSEDDLEEFRRWLKSRR